MLGQLQLGGVNEDEIVVIAKYLENAGHYVSCPKLKGHTGNKKDMKNANYKDWIKSIEDEYLILSETFHEIIMIGFSMGGLIGINLSEHYEFHALITLNSPIYYWDFKVVFKNILMDLKNKENENIKKYWDSCFKFPIRALFNFQLILHLTKNKLKNVKCPLFIIQSKDDDTANSASAKYIYDHVSSQIKEIKYYDNGGHLILKSSSANMVCKDIGIFINENKGNILGV